MMVYGVLHTVLFVLYRRLQFHRPAPREWLDYVALNPSSQLIATPMAIVLAEVSRQLSGNAIGLALTAACALALPLARQELAYYHQSQQMLEEIAEAMIRVLDRVMPGAREHGERVSRIAVETGRRLGLSERALMTLGLAARLHDVGLLTKADVSAGKGANGSVAKAVQDHVPDRLLAAIIQAHHERWVDREGHRPQRRTLVSLGASILAAAELYDSARMGMRPFNRPISRAAVERELTRLAGSTLDPDIVPVILRVGQEFGAELVGVL
jgi:HD-GYP domain-containing protein (c-di-GMP phosphodiesterase class II)